MRVGVGPNIEADGKPVYNNCGAPTQRISKRNSTNNGSWRGPNIVAGGKPANNNVEVGAGRR
ncbi:hypothetical protein AXE89_11085 [Staphylococcus aureus]|nr:hypothetical protein [Staphylococcus aureus]